MSDKKKKDKNRKPSKRHYWPEVLLVLSAMILGVLVVFMVYKTTHKQTTTDPQDYTISGNVPKPSELRSEHKNVYFAIMEIPNSIFEKMNGVTYFEDCPVSRAELRYVKVLYWGVDNEPHTGALIVNEKIAEKVQHIFYMLYSASYPIERVELVDNYGGNDEVSMAYNNTSSFNCRKATGSKGSWSSHAYGLAIDLNPLYNPYVSEDGTVILPLDGEPYADRTQTFNMKISENDYAYTLFMEAGFTWGGSWEGVKDYQHFEYVLTE